ncbi:hypothetical protein [Agromyces neolithicus]|uniref:Uncharacterized protein n=1 Tax=Agromyces neolithicus TaxID=269420 RepID=A0ABP4YN95_9MICO
MPNQDIRTMLQATKEARERAEREFFEKLDHSSLTALALSAADAKRASDDAAEDAKREKQAHLRRAWAEAYLARMAPRMTEYFAKAMKLDPESPLLAELKWRLDPADLDDSDFIESEQGITPRPRVDRHEMYYPLTDVDLVTIRAYPGNIDGELATATFFVVDGPGSHTGISSLADLGLAIARARGKAEAGNEG